MSNTPLNRITVLFFATFRERSGVDRAFIDLPENGRIRDLKSRLLLDYPKLAGMLESALFSINHEFAFDDDVIPPEAELAVFPPVSGGAEEEFPTVIAIIEEMLDLDALLERITLPTTGAACVFTGMVRGITGAPGDRQQNTPHQTLSLEYEAYAPMAEAKMRQVAEEIRTSWPAVQGIVIVQRVGNMAPGTPTVVIACTAAHRDTGVFEATRYGIDRLKEIVPIWKKEIGTEGETWIEGKYVPNRSDT
jgi:molybdopterin synthase catalytic subunit/molybdopterin converting factor small subunit